MKCHDTRLSGSIVDNTRRRHEACHASNTNHMALVAPNHSGQELLAHPKVRHDVDLEYFGHSLVGIVDNGPRTANSGIVD